MQEIPNGFLLLLGAPLADKVIQCGIFAPDIFFRVVHNALLPQQFSVGIVDGDRFMDNLYLTAIAADNGFHLRVSGRCGWFNRITTLSDVRSLSKRYKTGINFDRSIPSRVGKQSGHIAEVHDHKVGLAFLLSGEYYDQ